MQRDERRRHRAVQVAGQLRPLVLRRRLGDDVVGRPLLRHLRVLLPHAPSLPLVRAHEGRFVLEEEGRPPGRTYGGHVVRARDLVQRHAVVVDALVAALLAALSLSSMFDPPDFVTYDFREPDALGVALTVLANAAVAVRSRVPVPAFLVSITASLTVFALDYPQALGGVAALLVLYTVASRERLRTSVACAVGAWLGVVGIMLTAPVEVALADWFGNTFVLTTGWAVGRAVRTHRANVASLTERNRAMEAARESELRAAMAQERSRIAREMHDVVAHSLTAMTVQATAARRLVRRDPDAAEQALDAVQGAGRAALDELRRVLGVLRADNDDPADLAPQPGTADLGALVARVRDAGLDVLLEQVGDPVPLDAGVDLAAYRIVQESLTNALKHAGPARVHVRLSWTGEALDIRVEDDGRGAAVPAGGTGRGLRLLEERTGAYGGRLSAGPRTGGGFALTAVLPVRVPA